MYKCSPFHSSLSQRSQPVSPIKKCHTRAEKALTPEFQSISCHTSIACVMLCCAPANHFTLLSACVLCLLPPLLVSSYPISALIPGKKDPRSKYLHKKTLYHPAPSHHFKCPQCSEGNKRGVSDIRSPDWCVLRMSLVLVNINCRRAAKKTSNFSSASRKQEQ